MRQGREGSGRLPDERFHTDSIFGSISAYVPDSRVLTNLRTRERTTGADALLLIRTATGVWRFAIQAKGLMSHLQADPEQDADPPHYPQVGHQAANGRQQYDLLLQACSAGGPLAGFVPVHLFYNELTSRFDTNGAWLCRSVFPGDPTEYGVTYARTEDVKVIADGRMALNIRGHARFPYDLFRGVSRPWLCVLCPAGGGCSCQGVPDGPWPPRLDRDAPIDTSGFSPRTDFVPEPWPNEPIDPTAWTDDSAVEDVATAAMVDALLEGTVPRAREVVRPLARTALIVDVTAEERTIERLF
jgi:hypothetical protein